MNVNSTIVTAEDSAILLVPYMWIGDFVRCHSVVKLLRGRYPRRPVDVLTTTLCAPLLDYIAGDWRCASNGRWRRGWLLNTTAPPW